MITIMITDNNATTHTLKLLSSLVPGEKAHSALFYTSSKHRALNHKLV